MKIAVAGLGAAGVNIHLPAIRKQPRLKLIGAADPLAVPNDFAFPVFESFQELLNSTNPELVVIATPTSQHFEQCVTALEHGCHVFCEKPFVETLYQAAELVRLADDKNLQIAVNNEFRFMRIHQAAKAQIGQPILGQLLYVDMHQTFLTTSETEHGWRGDDPQRTCKEFGTHVFDLARFFFDADPITISARMPRPLRTGGPDYLNLIDLRFSEDRFARITLDRLSRGTHRYLDIRLDGESACIETSLGGRLAIGAGLNAKSRRPFLNFDIAKGGIARLVRGESRRRIAADPIDLFPSATAALLVNVVDAIRANTTPPCSGRDNIATLALMLAAYDSAASNQEIDMEQYIIDATSD